MVTVQLEMERIADERPLPCLDMSLPSNVLQLKMPQRDI